MPGVRIRHDTARSSMHVVPVLSKPYDDGGFVCPTCNVLHPVKSVHLMFDDRGECLVSTGVLDELRQAGMPDLAVAGHVTDPPTLTIGGRQTRAEMDYDNRKITEYMSV